MNGAGRANNPIGPPTRSVLSSSQLTPIMDRQINWRIHRAQHAEEHIRDQAGPRGRAIRRLAPERFPGESKIETPEQLTLTNNQCRQRAQRSLTIDH
jgi:hypothetical protein